MGNWDCKYCGAKEGEGCKGIPCVTADRLLSQEKEKFKAFYDATVNAGLEREQKVKALDLQVKGLTNALDTYGNHHESCGCRGSSGICTCGLTAILFHTKMTEKSEGLPPSRWSDDLLKKMADEEEKAGGIHIGLTLSQIVEWTKKREGQDEKA